MTTRSAGNQEAGWHYWASSKDGHFEPDQRMHKILSEAAMIGAAISRSMSWASRDEKVYFYPEDDRTWFSAFAVGSHIFQVDNWLHHDARSMFHYNATGITPAMAVAMPGIGSQYAAAACDSEGNWLDGSHTYKLTLPPNPLRKISGQLWFTIRKLARCCKLTNNSPVPIVRRGNVEQNADGSTDVYFGPKPPTGKEKNWVQTVPGKGFWIILRLYAPLEPWFDKTWRPGAIIKLD